MTRKMDSFWFLAPLEVTVNHDSSRRTARSPISAELVARAECDPAFRAALLADPKATLQRAFGLTLPADLTLHVHEETPWALHLVLPLSAADDAALTRQIELGDREVAGYADKSSDQTEYATFGRTVGGSASQI